MSYISRFETETYSFYTYKNETLYLDANLMSKILFPGLLHELKSYSSNHEFFRELQTAPSKYILPSYIDPTKLTEQLRSIIGSTLIFVFVWSKENTPNSINSQYKDYFTFFISILTNIINKESNESVKNLAINLKQEIKKISPYIGTYNGYFPNNFFKTNTLLHSLLLFYLYINL
jgi:hypothetical protein